MPDGSQTLNPNLSFFLVPFKSTNAVSCPNPTSKQNVLFQKNLSLFEASFNTEVPLMGGVCFMQ